jgi:hypothetical protein
MMNVDLIRTTKYAKIVGRFQLTLHITRKICDKIMGLYFLKKSLPI